MKKQEILRSNPALSIIRGSILWLREGKNCAISNAKVLVKQLFIQSKHIRYVKKVPELVVNYCLSPLS